MVGAVQQFEPTYSAALAWQVSPKFALTATSARTVGAPTSLVANAQVYETQNLALYYQATPRAALQAGLGYSSSGGSLASGWSFSTSNAFETARATTLFARATYAITPFLVANGSVQYSDRLSGRYNAHANIVTIGLTYAPR